MLPKLVSKHFSREYELVVDTKTMKRAGFGHVFNLKIRKSDELQDFFCPAQKLWMEA